MGMATTRGEQNTRETTTLKGNHMSTTQKLQHEKKKTSAPRGGTTKKGNTQWQHTIRSQRHWSHLHSRQRKLPLQRDQHKVQQNLPPPNRRHSYRIKIAKLRLNVREPAKTVDIVPVLDQTLLSGSKFADAGYTAVYDKNEVNFYDAETVRIDTKAII